VYYLRNRLLNSKNKKGVKDRNEEAENRNTEIKYRDMHAVLS